jgi:hypothetical protein
VRDHWLAREVRKVCLFLVSDRAGQFTASSAILASAGIQAMRIPPIPRASAYAERFVLTRTEPRSTA